MLFTAYGGAIEQARVAVLDLDSRRLTDVVTGGAYGRFLPPDRIAYYRAGNIFTVPVDLARLTVTGAPVPVLQHVAADRLTAMPLFGTSASGHLAWVPDSQFVAPSEVMWLDQTGKATPAVAERQSRSATLGSRLMAAGSPSRSRGTGLTSGWWSWRPAPGRD